MWRHMTVCRLFCVESCDVTWPSVDCSVWSHVTSHDSTYTLDNLHSIIWNHRPLHTVLTISCWFVRTSYLSTFKSDICVKLGIKPKSPILHWPQNNHQPLQPSNGCGCLVAVATCTIHSGVVTDSAFTNTCALHIEDYETWWLFGSCSSVVEHWLLKAASVQQRKALKTQSRCAITHTTPTGNIPEAPELGTPHYSKQNFGPQRCPL